MKLHSRQCFIAKNGNCHLIFILKNNEICVPVSVLTAKVLHEKDQKHPNDYVGNVIFAEEKNRGYGSDKKNTVITNPSCNLQHWHLADFGMTTTVDPGGLKRAAFSTRNLLFSSRISASVA
jgi:hypothetical protein